MSYCSVRIDERFLTTGVTPVQANIYTPPNTMPIAPYTALFSALDSTSPADDPIVRWYWNFGDTNSADPDNDEGLIVAHRFDNPGTYTIRLTIITKIGHTVVTTSDVTITAFSGYTYYVDATGGSDAWTEPQARNNINCPWQTINRAKTALLPRVLNTPSKVLLKRGQTFVIAGEQIVPFPSIMAPYGNGPDPIITGGYLSWLSYTTYGWAPILEDIHLIGSAPWATETLISAMIPGSVLRRCTLENGGITATAQRFGLVIEDCVIHHARRQGVYAESAQNGGDIVIRRNTIYSCGTSAVLDHGVYINGSEDHNNYGGRPSARNMLIENNTLYDNSNFGLNLRMHDGCVVRGNECFGDGNYAYFTPSLGNGNGISLNSMWRCVSERNLLHDLSASQAIAFSTKSAGDWFVLRNNIVHHVKFGIGFLNPWNPSTQGSGTTYCYNNTVVTALGNQWDYALLFWNNYFYAGASGVIRNNIVTNTAASSGCLLREEIYLAGPSGLPFWTFDYNRYYGPFNSTTAWNGGTFAAWQSTGFSTHESNGDPMINTATYELEAGSPCIDAGTATPYVWNDFDGDARIGTPSIGAKE